MGREVRIPVRVVRSMQDPTVPDTTKGSTLPAQSSLVKASPSSIELASATTEPVETMTTAGSGARDAETDWYDRALRLQAEMENYRKRQQRLAQDQIEEERQRLLRGFLRIVDNLERALAASDDDTLALRGTDGEKLRQGVQLTHRAALQLLEREGVERVQAQNQPFDPAWQEAVSTVAHDQVNAVPNTVVQVLEPGYRQGDRLLRPAKVVVAV